MKRLVLIFLACLPLLTAFGQQGVVIGKKDGAPNPYAKLEIYSTSTGLLIPRMTTAEREAINPDGSAISLLVFDLNDSTYYFFNGQVWEKMSANRDIVLLTSQMDTMRIRLMESIDSLGTVIDEEVGSAIDSLKSKVASDSAYFAFQLDSSVDSLISKVKADSLYFAIHIDSSTNAINTRIDTTIIFIENRYGLRDLSNLDSVAINTDLTPGISGDVNLGSSDKRFGNLYLTDSIFMGQDTIIDIAQAKDWVEADTLNGTTISSVGYTHKALKEGGNEIDFLYGTKPVTRTGLPGVTGQSMDVANIEEFLKKIFFPVTSPKINSFNYNGVVTAGNFSYQDEDAQRLLSDNVGTVSIPFSVWNASNFTFNYQVENRSVRPTDTSEDTPIDSVVIYNGPVRLAKNVHGVLDANISGSYSLAKDGFSVDIDNPVTNKLSVNVYDAYPNVVPLKLDVNFEPALGVLVSTAEVTANNSPNRYTSPLPANGTNLNPYLIERTGNPIDLDIYWTFDSRDDNGQITDFAFQTNGGHFTPTTITGTNLTDQRTDLVIPNTHTAIFRYGVQARGAVANDWSSPSFTRYYQLADRFYRGVVSDTSNINSEAILAQLTVGNRLKHDWVAANVSQPGSGATSNDGYDFAMTPGRFAVFAIPITNAADIANYGIEIFDISWGGKKSTFSEAIGKHVINVTGKGVTQYLIIYRTESASANTTWTLRLSK
jgi:hypothetical protein